MDPAHHTCKLPFVPRNEDEARIKILMDHFSGYRAIELAVTEKKLGVHPVGRGFLRTSMGWAVATLVLAVSLYTGSIYTLPLPSSKERSWLPSLLVIFAGVFLMMFAFYLLSIVAAMQLQRRHTDVSESFLLRLWKYRRGSIEATEKERQLMDEVAKTWDAIKRRHSDDLALSRKSVLMIPRETRRRSAYRWSADGAQQQTEQRRQTEQPREMGEGML